jgi:signal transduction histidine kinase
MEFLTGTGAAMVKQKGHHGGRLCAEDNPLGGAIFSFTLPALS